MNEQDSIYMADDAISGADVYKPITDWTKEKLNQPFEPLFDSRPTGFTMDHDDRPGVKAWRFMNPENPLPSMKEATCSITAPMKKERSLGGEATMNYRAFSPKQGLFGTTDEPCLKEAGREKFSQDFTNTMSDAADWINQGGAATESSINPQENRDWQKTPSLRLGKSFEATPSRRDYGVPQNQEFSIEKTYKPGLARDISEHLMNPVYGQSGHSASAELKNRYVSTHSAVNGKDLWNRLKNDFGVEQAAQIINRLGYFSGVRGNPTFSGNEVIRFAPNEAERAMARLEQEGRSRELPLKPAYDEYGYDYEPGPDPRQYGVPKNTPFSTSANYRPEMAEDLSRIVNAPDFSADPEERQRGELIAREMRHDYARTGNDLPGPYFYDHLVRNFGQEKAHEILRRLDYFSGVDGFIREGDSSSQRQAVDFDTRPGEGYPALFK